MSLAFSAVVFVDLLRRPSSRSRNSSRGLSTVGVKRIELLCHVGVAPCEFVWLITTAHCEPSGACEAVEITTSASSRSWPCLSGNRMRQC